MEINTVISQKSNNDNVLLTIVECKIRYTMILEIVAKTAVAVTDALKGVSNLFGEQFSQVFKSITGNTGFDFVGLYIIKAETDTKIYFTQPYSFLKRGLTNVIMT